MMRQPTRTSKYRRRKGYTLVIFAMLLFALFALAALVIDLGLVRLTQRQMQTAVDSAALEGLRFRDGVPAAWLTNTEILEHVGDPPNTPQDPDDSEWEAWYEQVRRWAAGRIAAEHYGSVFGNAEDAIEAMEGNPQIDPAFSAMLKQGIYSPNLRSNFDAESGGNISSSGDMLAGKYTRADGHLAALEDSDYSRNDFVPEPKGDAFLVRLRRTGEEQDEDARSSGDRIPFLFARGSLLNPSLKSRGVAVRATGIANVLPAKSVGSSNPDHEIIGSAALAFYASRWQSVSSVNSQPTVVSLESDGSLEVAGIGYGFARNQNGESAFTTIGDVAHAAPYATFEPEAFQVGLATSLASNAAGSAPLFGFVAIIPNEGLPLNERLLKSVIGFAYAQVSVGENNSFNLTRINPYVAHQNAMATFSRKIDAYFRDAANAADLQTLLELHNDKVHFEFPLLAPALVR